MHSICQGPHQEYKNYASYFNREDLILGIAWMGLGPWNDKKEH